MEIKFLLLIFPEFEWIMYMFYLLSSPGQGNPGFSGTDGKTAEIKEEKINHKYNYYTEIYIQKNTAQKNDCLFHSFHLFFFFFLKEATFITILF